MGASKRAKNIRVEEEFDYARLKGRLERPREGSDIVHSWTLEKILAARDMQMRGHFYLPARMAEATHANDAIFVPYRNRLDPQRNVAIEMVPASEKTKAISVSAECDAQFGQKGTGVHPGTNVDINACLVEHGIAFGYNVATPRDDGSRVDYEHRYWPIEYVRWDSYRRQYLTRVDPSTVQKGDTLVQDPALGLIGGYEVEIHHGDGRWVIYANHEVDPFKKEAALLSSCLVWACHAFAGKSWSSAADAHALAKFLGQMPAGVVLQKDGKLTKEAESMVQLMLDFANGDSKAGVIPAGASMQFLVNSSTAWQIFAELVSKGERSAARIYLGTDATLGAKGGAPGVDITALFGVSITKVRGDLGCMERGFQTGVIEPWTAMNFGDSTLAPTRRYMLPDPDKDAWQAGIATRRTAFFADIDTARKTGFAITQEYVDQTAKEYDVIAPKLAELEDEETTDAGAKPLAIASADLVGVVSANEARAAAGLGEWLLDGVPDPDGNLTVAQFVAKKAVVVAPPPAAAPVVAPAPEPPAALHADVAKALAAFDARLSAIRDAPAARGFAERNAAFQADLKDYRANGLCIDQAEIEQLAKLHDVPAPRLAAERE